MRRAASRDIVLHEHRSIELLHAGLTGIEPLAISDLGDDTMKIALIVALLSSALATPAVAQTAIAENFDSEAGGGTALSYNSFSQFDVTNGSVDVLHQPNSFSLNCSGRGGSCVDLDGTTNSGGTLTTKNALLFNAGRLVTLLFDLSGNQRGAGSDNFFAGFDFGAGSGAVVNDFTFGGCFGNFNFGSFGRVNSATACCTTYDAAPFSRYSISFTSGSTGTVKGFIGTDSVDSQGPILDNFSLSVAGVPEPSIWALMFVGFGAVGSSMRRRTKLRTAIGFA